MSVHSAEITTENLLKAVVNLPKNEFERLIANAKKLRRTLPKNQANKEKGRVTIKVLKLNRQRVTNLRKILVLAGEHPPNMED